MPLPQIERCHDRDRVMSPTAPLKEKPRRRKQAVFRGASLNADVHSALLQGERKSHSFRTVRNVAETRQQEGRGAVWPTYLQRNFMEGKFISLIAIRVLCFTSFHEAQKTMNKASVRPSNFSVCSNQISSYISMPVFDGFL